MARNGNDWADILMSGKDLPENYWKGLEFQEWAETTPRKIFTKQFSTKAYREDPGMWPKPVKYLPTPQETDERIRKWEIEKKEKEEYQEKYSELTNYDKEVSTFMKSREYQSYEASDKLTFYEKVQAKRNQIKDRIDKKFADITKAEADADEDFPYKELLKVIKRVNAGETSPAELVTFLNYHDASETLKKDVMEDIAPPATAIEREEIKASEEERERKQKEDEFLATYSDKYSFVGLSDKKGALVQKAIQASDKLEFDKDTETFDQTMRGIQQEFTQEQASIGQQNWQAVFDRESGVLEEKKRQWTAEFGAARAQELFDNGMIKLEYEEDIREAQAKEKLDGDTALMNYDIATIKEERENMVALHTMGWKDKTANQAAYEFIMTLDYKKDESKKLAQQWGQEYRLSVQQETNAVNQFQQSLEREYKDLNIKINRLGLDRDIEVRLAKTAEFTAMMEIKNYGLDVAKQRLSEIDQEKKWIFKDYYYKLDNEEAQANVLKIMSSIYNDAERLGNETAFNNARIKNMDNKLKFDYDKLEQDAKDNDVSPLQITPGLSVTLGNMSPEIQNDITRMIGTAYDEDKGFYHPKPEEMELITNFWFGRDGDSREKERFGVNLDVDEYVRACAGQFDWSDQMKGWAIITKDKPYMWEDVWTAGIEKGVAIPKDIEDTTERGGGLAQFGRDILGGLQKWNPFNWGKTPGLETVMKATPTGNLEADADNLLTARGGETPWSEILNTLTSSPYNYSEADVRAIFGR